MNLLGQAFRGFCIWSVLLCYALTIAYAAGHYDPNTIPPLDLWRIVIGSTAMAVVVVGILDDLEKICRDHTHPK